MPDPPDAISLHFKGVGPDSHPGCGVSCTLQSQRVQQVLLPQNPDLAW